MSDTTRAISSELLKLKRTLALRVSVGAPLAVALLNFVVYTQRQAEANAVQAQLLGFIQLNLTTWTIIMLPLYVAVAAALVASLDHQGDHWKHLLALPVAPWTLFVAKWVAAGGLVLMSSLVLAAAVSVAAEALKLMKPAWRGGSVPFALLWIRAFQTFCAAALILSIQLWVSLRWKSFIPGLFVGIAGVMILLGGVARFGRGTIVMYIYPWALPPTAMARMAEYHPDRLLVSAWGLVAGVLVATIGCWHLARREMT